MEQLVFVSKSSEKSSPSFPEDVEDDEEEPLELDPPRLKCNSEAGTGTTATTSTASEVVDMVVVSDSNPTDVTMHAEDEEEDDDLEEGGVDLVGGGGGVRGEVDDTGCTMSIGSELTRSFALNSVDSPRHPADSSEKKVHWSNHHVQTLLDCVEKHLDEFNIQKKHKQVWQTIGGEMESFGFTMEHCYNKWKNLRRDVRLLVNNPQKVVRNADILRRVARLILVIHPNIDATTMQVTGTGCASLLGDRNGRSAPNTPGGGLSSRGFVSSSLHGPNSPRYPMNSSSTTNTPNSHLYHHHHHHSLTTGFRHTPNGSGGGITSEDLKSLKREGHDGQAPPSTALFINLGPECDPQPEHSQPQHSQQAVANHHQQHLSGQSQSSQQQQQSLLASVVSDVAAAAVAAAAAATTTTSDETMTTTTSTSFPFFFSPAAAALLVQSQLLNDLIRQQQQPQQQQHIDEHMALVSSDTVVTGAHAAASTPKPVATNGNVCHQHNHQPMQFEIHQQHQPQQPTPDVVTLATTLLNGLSSVAAAASAASTDHPHQQHQAQPLTPQHLPGVGHTPLLPPILSTTSGAAPGCTSSNAGGGNSLLLGCHLPPGTELAGVVERLRDEETVHLRLTDCVSHLANELRAAGLRRRQALDQLLVLLQAARLQQTVAPAAVSLVTSTKQAATSVTTPTITKQASSHD